MNEEVVLGVATPRPYGYVVARCVKCGSGSQLLIISGQAINKQQKLDSNMYRPGL